MPNVPCDGPYHIYFYSDEGNEPPHIHVQRERMRAKFWLLPVKLADSDGFSKHELRKIERLVIEIELQAWERWNAHFDENQ